MPSDYDPTHTTLQEPSALSAHLAQRLADFVAPLLMALDAHIDVRLVRTFLATLRAILVFRHRACGLLLSELGAYLSDPAHAPAGTKRLSNLLRSEKWQAALIETFLWRQAEQRRQQLEANGQDALMLWDESVVEKNESRGAEGLCAVRSSKAKRCLSIKPGFYRPPTTQPVFVPGLHWLAGMLCGLTGAPTVAFMGWWSTRGEGKSSARQQQARLLEKVSAAWGRLVLHVFDRGYSGSPWLGQLLQEQLRFILRWPARYYLHDDHGFAFKTWQLFRGKRAQDVRYVEIQGHLIQLSLLWRPVRHPDYADALWLVVARRGGGQPPWYLLTSEPIQNGEDAWGIVRAYARRWQIELAFRYNKSELALESPRLWRWERRVKLMMVVTVVYAFLLSLLAPLLAGLCALLLRQYCHRTGKRSREVAAPLYRLRSAISRLWLEYPGLPVQKTRQNPG